MGDGGRTQLARDRPPTVGAVLALLLIGCGARTGVGEHDAGVDAHGHHDVVDAGVQDAAEGRDSGDAARDSAVMDAMSGPDAGTDAGPVDRPDLGPRVPPIVDVNGDGLEDLVVGADMANRVYVFHGNGATFDTSWSARLSGPIFEFGYRLTVPGDMNGDGIDDLVVAGRSSRTFVYLGTPTGISPEPVYETEFAGDEVMELDSAGDLDGDGAVEVLVTDIAQCLAEIWWSGSVYPPRRSVVLRGDVGTPCWTPWARGGGDVDHDGRPDFVTSQRGLGRVIVFRGTPAGGEPISVIESVVRIGTVDTSFAMAAELVGDLDGDGWIELVIEQWTPHNFHVLWGGPEGYALARESLVPAPDRARSGISLIEAGDLDGDGLADFVVSGPGSVTIFFGSRDRDFPSVVYSEPRWDFGVPVQSLGDVNGDGHPEVAVAATYENDEVTILSVGTDRSVRVLQRVHGDGGFGGSHERFGVAIGGR
jgi:hypothetical protein